MKGAIIAWCAVTVACGATTTAPRPVQPRIEVPSMTCPASSDARARLARVIAAHGATATDLVIRVDVSGGPANEIHLRISRSTGDVGVDRTFVLGPGDCASASELLALALDRFLSAFPEWAGPARPSPPPQRWTELAVVTAVSSIWVPFGVDGQVGAFVDRGSRHHRIGGGLLARGSFPQAAGSGRFQQTALLGGVGYRYLGENWQLRVQVRGGGLLVTGLGFDENRSDLLPWWEGAVYAGRVVSWGSIGVEVAASGLRHKAVTTDGMVSEDIPLFRLGLAGELGVASKRP